MSREFINAASKDEVEALKKRTETAIFGNMRTIVETRKDFEILKEELMRYSKKSKDAFVLACISLACNFAICLYLILTA